VVGDQVVAEVDRLHHVVGAKVFTAQDGDESPPEVRIEGVDDGIEGRVGPPDPNKGVENGLADARQLSWFVPGGITKGHHAVEHKERQPAEDKDAHDDGEGLEDLGLLLEGALQVGCVRARAAAAALGAFQCAFQGEPADLPLGNAEDAAVGHDHDGNRDVEADEGRRDGVSPVEVRITALPGDVLPLVELLVLVPPQLHGDEGNEEGQQPRHPNHGRSHTWCHPPLVAEGVGDGPVAVHADDAQIEDRGGGAHDVKSHPDVAESPKGPKPHRLSSSPPRHHQHGQQEVGHSQGDDEEVGDLGA